MENEIKEIGREAPEKKKNLLIVDDVTVNRMILEEMFSGLYDIFQAENGKKAMEIMLNNKIDIVILDLYMPEMDGYEVLQEMKKHPVLRYISVLVVTVSKDDESIIKAMQCGAQDVMLKPYHPDIMRLRIANMLSHHEALSTIRKTELMHDALSGLLRREAFAHLAAEPIQSQPARTYVICCLNINGFKVINDRFGHSEGDRLLRYIGGLCNVAITRSGGLACRDMGDIFFLLLKNDSITLSHTVERLYTELKGYNLPINIKLQVGKYVVDEPQIDVDLMMDRALIAVRSIKDSVMQQEAQFYPEMRERLLWENEIESDMWQALETRQFEVYFQPQYNYASKKMIGAETLVRWKHPVKGLISPGVFIPLFEKNGFISNLDMFVWEEACKYLRKWIDEGHADISVSVNISRRDIWSIDVAQVIALLAEKYEIPANRLHLEITESAYMEHPTELIKNVERLQGMGFVVEMDDFGSGYSSLNLLKNVPVDVLKLDMEFVHDSANNKRGGSIISSVVRMAHWLNIPVIAEGIETIEMAEYFKSIGCLLMQGYYFSRPLPVAQFEELLHSSDIADKQYEISTNSIDSAVNFLNASEQSTLLFNSFVGGAMIIEYDGEKLEILRTNDKFYEVLNCSREDFIKIDKNVAEHFIKGTRDLFIEAVKSAISTGNETSCEVCSIPIGENKSEVWSVCRFRFIAQNVHRFILYVSIQNITKRKKLERELAAEVKRNRALMSNTPAGVITLSVVNHKIACEYFSEGLSNMLGYSYDEMKAHLQKDYTFGIFAEDKDRVNETISRMTVKNMDTFKENYRLIKKDGTVIWVNLTGTPVLEDDGALRFYCAYTDLSELYQNIQALNIENLRNRLLIETNRIALIDYDVNSDTMFYEGFRENNGIDQMEIKGFSNYIENATDVRHITKEAFEQIKQAASNLSGESFVEYQADLWGSGVRWGRLMYSALADEDGKVYRIIGSLTDVQNEKDREEAIKLLSLNSGALAYEPHIIADIFAYLNCSAQDDEAIGSVLKILGEHYRLSRAYIFEKAEDDSYYTNTFEWCANGIKHEKYSMQEVFHTDIEFGEIMDSMNERGYYLYEPEKVRSQKLKELLSKQGKLSMLLCEIKYNGRITGFIGFDDCVTARSWDPEAIGTLSVLGSIMSFYLFRKREKEAGLLSDDFIAALEANPGIVLIVDPKSFDIIFANKAVYSYFPDFKNGAKCYCMRNEQCTVCPINEYIKTGVPVSLELKQGAHVFIEQASPIRWRGRDLFMVICTDITAQKKDQAELRINEQSFRIAASRADCIVYRYDIEQHKLTTLADLAEAYRLPREIENVPDSVVEHGKVSSEYIQAYKSFYNDIDRGIEGKTIEFKRKLLDGEFHYFRGDYSLIRSESGNPITAIITFTNIDNEKQRELIDKPKK